MRLWKKLLIAVAACFLVVILGGNIVNCTSVVRRTVPMWLVASDVRIEDVDKEYEESNLYGTVVEEKDGAVTLDMNKDQYELLLEKAQTFFDDKLAAIPGSVGYENVVGIRHNKHYSYFAVATLNDRMTMEERALAVILKSYGQMYASVLGVGNQGVRIEFVRSKTDTVIGEIRN